MKLPGLLRQRIGKVSKRPPLEPVNHQEGEREDTDIDEVDIARSTRLVWLFFLIVIALVIWSYFSRDKAEGEDVSHVSSASEYQYNGGDAVINMVVDEGSFVEPGDILAYLSSARLEPNGAQEEASRPAGRKKYIPVRSPVRGVVKKVFISRRDQLAAHDDWLVELSSLSDNMTVNVGVGHHGVVFSYSGSSPYDNELAYDQWLYADIGRGLNCIREGVEGVEKSEGKWRDKCYFVPLNMQEEYPQAIESRPETIGEKLFESSHAAVKVSSALDAAVGLPIGTAGMEKPGQAWEEE